MSHVFISYARSDAEYVQRLAAYLEAAGVPTWYDVEIEPGSEFRQQIQQAIFDCAALIIVLTPESTESKWVRRELAYADDIGKPIFPILLASCNISLEVCGLQREDVREARTMPTAVLVDSLRRLFPRNSPEVHAPEVSTELLLASMEALRRELGRAIPDPRVADAVLLSLFLGLGLLIEDRTGLVGGAIGRSLAAQFAGATVGRMSVGELSDSADFLGVQFVDPFTNQATARLGPAFSNIAIVEGIDQARGDFRRALAAYLSSEEIVVGGVRHRVPRPRLCVLVTDSDTWIRTDAPTALIGKCITVVAFARTDQVDQMKDLLREDAGPPGTLMSTSPPPRLRTITERLSHRYSAALPKPLMAEGSFPRLERALMNQVHTRPEILLYIDDLVQRIWLDSTALGQATAKLRLAKACKVIAGASGRHWCTPDDVREAARLLFWPTARS